MTSSLGHRSHAHFGSASQAAVLSGDTKILVPYIHVTHDLPDYLFTQ